MTFAQFDIAGMVRCPVTNEEGFRCRLRPNHEGEHDWARCVWTDDRGARCMLPVRHPSVHVLFWYDEDRPIGAKRTLQFAGSEPQARRIADRAAGLAARRGWVEVERAYRLSWYWRFRPLGAFMGLFTDPQGGMRVIFERRDTDTGVE